MGAQEPLCPLCGLAPLPFSLRHSARLDWFLLVQDALAQAEATDEIVLIVRPRQEVGV
jgi:hypothetical protein